MIPKNGLLVSKNTAITQVYLQSLSSVGKEVNVSNLGVMLRYAEITDDAYEPYVDDLQTQIQKLMDRVTELENK